MINEHGLLAVKTEPGKITVVENPKVILLRAAGNYVELFFEDGRLLHRATLQSMLGKMPEYFVQIHRSYAVNLKHLKHIQSELGRYTECVMSDGQQVPIGPQFRSLLMMKLGLQSDD